MTALSSRQPDVAATVVATAAPEFAVAAPGRDGTSTFRIRDAQGGIRWFGGSSMPRISAREILAGFVSDGRNVILPGVLTGVEPIVLAEKLPLHAAVFVVEEDPARLKLALSVHDYAGLIAAGRIVFILGDAQNHADGMCRFFEAHPGYELPMHLIPVPQRTPAQIADLQSGIEAAGRAVVDIHARVVEHLVGRIRGGTRGVFPDAPSVAVLGVDPMPESLAQAHRIDRALTQLNWPHSTCVPDAPQRCHLAARLAAVDHVRADMILLCNTTTGLSGVDLHTSQVDPNDRRDGLAGGLPVVAWHLPGSRPLAPQTLSEGSLQSGKPAVRMHFASSLSIYGGLVTAGCRSNRIEHCGVAADTITFRPLGFRRDESCVDVAVIADLPDARAESCNIVLDSHVALWRALTKVVLRHVDDGLSDAVLLLEEAQRMSHAVVREPEIRDQFLRLLRGRLVPAVRSRAAVEALHRAGHGIQVWGLNWQGVAGRADVLRGPVPEGEALNKVFNGVRVVVLVDSSPWSVQTALDAIAAGAAVVCLSGAEPFEKEHPCLAAIRTCLHPYTTRHELIHHVDSLVKTGRPFDGSTSAETERIRSEHSVVRRLEQIADTIRRCQAQPGKG